MAFPKTKADFFFGIQNDIFNYPKTTDIKFLQFFHITKARGDNIHTRLKAFRTDNYRNDLLGAPVLCKFGQRQLVMGNYAWGFNQLKTGKYFEWIIMTIIELLLLLLLQVKPEITIYNYISHKKVDIRQRNEMMAEKGNF